MVGLGSIGQRHMRNLRILLGEEVQFSAFRVINRNHLLTDNLEVVQGKQLEHEFNLRVYHDLNQALSKKPDVVFVTNPTSKHIEVAIAAANAGCDLFIEKPLSHSLENVQQLQDIVTKKNIICYVGFQNRYHPSLQTVYQLINERSIGNIIGVNAEIGEYLPDWHKYEDYRAMYAAKNDLGGGVILTQIHELDYLYWFFGLPHRVFAMGGKLSNLEIDVEDVSSTLLEFCIHGRFVPVHLYTDYVQKPTSRSLKIIGDNGKIIVDLANYSIVHYSGAGEVINETYFQEFHRNDMFMNEIQSFLSSVRDRTVPYITLQDGINSLKIALAIKQSIVTQQPIHLIQ